TALREGRSLEPWIAMLNRARRQHPALQQLSTLQFHPVDNDDLLVFSKTDPAGGDTVVCVITLDPVKPQAGVVRLDLASFGLDPGQRLRLRDEVNGCTREWGSVSWVEIDPARAVAQILTANEA